MPVALSHFAYTTYRDIPENLIKIYTMFDVVAEKAILILVYLVYFILVLFQLVGGENISISLGVWCG